MILRLCSGQVCTDFRKRLFTRQRFSGGHRLKLFLLILSICYLFPVTRYSLPDTYLYSQTNPDIYFNSAIDKYVKGDYEGAIELFEKILSQNPQNQKVENFLVRVLIEAAEKQVLVSNYHKAKIYIEKAKVVSPEDTKVNELLKVISGGPTKKEPVINENRTVQETTQKRESVKKNVNSVPMGKKINPTNKEDIVEKPKIAENFIESVKNEKVEDNYKMYFIILIIFVVIIAGLFIVFYYRTVKNLKKMEKMKNNLQIEERNKLRQSAKIKIIDEERQKGEVESILKIQTLEKKLVTESDSKNAQQKFEETIQENIILDDIANAVKKEEYSRQIIQKMIISIKTIMNINKTAALENILNLSKSDQSRLRYDCVKVIENILTVDTFKILLSLLNDKDVEVKKTAIIAINNICKLQPPDIPSEVISNAKKVIQEEKIRNGWII
ncbi:MAG: hypothetical protein A2539_09415 [Elusimicrobia bacterium RIFOXYD2_FULL_34_15]|nr:MAG: hypothetical protein A2539_09415 [Elusimicrobia bacterium RIFOXYD2_FULL_34_15]